MQCLVAAPSLIPQATGNRVKTDRKDALKLAVFAANSQLAPVWVPPVENREERQLLRQRTQFMEQRRRLQNQIKSFLSFHGLEMEEGNYWSNKFIQELQKLKLSPKLRFNLNIYLKSWQSLSLILDELGQELKNLWKTHEKYPLTKLLTSAPGIGELSAIEIILEIGDMSRFSNSDQFAAYLGLTPSQFSSANKTRMGRITKAGKSHLRGTLIECAWTAIQFDVGLDKMYNAIKIRSGGKRAIVAVARHLALRLRQMWLKNEPYKYDK